MEKRLELKFWGTRGSMIPAKPELHFGIHSTCVEIGGGNGKSLFIDLGTGSVPAMQAAIDRGMREFTVLMTHLHSDHINGVFGCTPFYRPDCRIRIFSTRPDTEQAFHTLFHSPFHPVEFSQLQATIEFVQLDKRGVRSFSEFGFDVSWGQLPHPQGSVGYRVDDGENALVFATDVELGKTRFIDELKKLLMHPYPAGLAVFDGFFTPSEIDGFADWGHGTWEQALELAAAAGVGKAVITHHHPNRSDDALEKMAEQGRPAVWASDGQLWSLQTNQAKSIA